MATVFIPRDVVNPAIIPVPSQSATVQVAMVFIPRDVVNPAIFPVSSRLAMVQVATVSTPRGGVKPAMLPVGGRPGKKSSTAAGKKTGHAAKTDETQKLASPGFQVRW